MSEFFIGLMSGTSMDGIDAALVEFSDQDIHLVATHSHEIPNSLKYKLHLLSQNDESSHIDMLGEADTELGILFADATHELLKHSNTDASKVTAIGSHGQTIRHRPDLENNFSIQIGDANRISFITGITTVADFRRKDMAAGGEGAPLAPAFHKQIFHSNKEDRAILNIGGIANLTCLPADRSHKVTGFDCGPGNALMDAWIKEHQQTNFDQSGAWAANGQVNNELVSRLMQDAFIKQFPPKSTGKEHYNIEWLNAQLSQFPGVSPQDVQTSLCHFTCNSIAFALQHHMPTKPDTLIICGGGAHNTFLTNLLKQKCTDITIKTSNHYGVDADWVEAIAFAWLARQTLAKQPGNLTDVTGASQATILGAIFPA